MASQQALFQIVYGPIANDGTETHRTTLPMCVAEPFTPPSTDLHRLQQEVQRLNEDEGDDFHRYYVVPLRHLPPYIFLESPPLALSVNGAIAANSNNPLLLTNQTGPQ